jgi:hypothetical protein
LPTPPQPFNYTTQRTHYSLVAFPEERRENVLADLLSPKVIAAIAAGVARCVQIHPVFLRTAREMIAAFTHPVALERETALETSDIDPARQLEIDSWLHFFVAPVPSYKFAI